MILAEIHKKLFIDRGTIKESITYIQYDKNGNKSMKGKIEPIKKM